MEEEFHSREKHVICISFTYHPVGDTLSWMLLIQDILSSNINSALLGDDRERDSTEDSDEQKRDLYMLLEIPENQFCSDCDKECLLFDISKISSSGLGFINIWCFPL